MNHIGTREIATERLTLRRFEIEDAENMFYNWANDPEVTKYLTWPAHESVDTTETILKEWISKYDEKDFYQWAIELNAWGFASADSRRTRSANGSSPPSGRGFRSCTGEI